MSKILWKPFWISKYILKVLIKFYGFTNICYLKFLENGATALWIFFEICMEERLASTFCQMGQNVKASILLVVLKCIVVDYSNGNESFIGRLFSNYGSLNMLFHFFRYLIYSVFHETFVEKFLKKLSLFISNLKDPFQDGVYYRKLRCVTLWYRNYSPLNVKSWQICPFLQLFFQK